MPLGTISSSRERPELCPINPPAESTLKPETGIDYAAGGAEDHPAPQVA